MHCTPETYFLQMTIELIKSHLINPIIQFIYSTQTSFTNEACNAFNILNTHLSLILITSSKNNDAN